MFQGERGFAGSKGEEGEKVNYSAYVIYFFCLTIWYMANQIDLCSKGLRELFHWLISYFCYVNDSWNAEEQGGFYAC